MLSQFAWIASHALAAGWTTTKISLCRSAAPPPLRAPSKSCVLWCRNERIQGLPQRSISSAINFAISLRRTFA